MNYHDITKEDMLNGDGIRVVLWVSGCEIHCRGCQNPQTWDKNSGIEFDACALREILDALKPDYISGLTITGGHPFEEYNLRMVERIINTVKMCYPDKTIWVYTGYDFEMISEKKEFEHILKMIDVIVDGKYDEFRRDVSLPFVGSSNQRIWRNINGQWTADTKPFIKERLL